MSVETTFATVGSELLIYQREIFELSNMRDDESHDKEVYERKQKSIIERLKTNNSLYLYREFCIEFSLIPDDSLLNELEDSYNEEIMRLNENITKMEAEFGSVEVWQAKLEKARYLMKVGNKEEGLPLYSTVFQEATGITTKADLIFEQGLISFANCSINDCERFLTLADDMVKANSLDFEHKNRLNVYRALLYIWIRDLENASEKLLLSVKTFLAPEICSFADLMKYTVVISLITLSRAQLTQSLSECAELKQVANEISEYVELFEMFYEGNYTTILQKIYDVCEQMNNDIFLAKHSRFFFHELRLQCYQQFLDAYSVIKLDHMAETFSLDVNLLEKDIANLVANEKLSVKIDKQEGIITHVKGVRSDTGKMIRIADNLITRLENLSKVIAL
eukprot:TRINITY_DN2469_c0_g2_i2.p1 TRINITY_DN2469_c0_g2~~TRINITY_DN2469_c0_g2_i2.p1  ORF type:complete len:393 (+),score=113.96 TRINITY_DN2469_c0_g2_i2:605-1783(+)